MSQNGRPLRFLTIVLAGWTGARVALLWPTVDNPRDLIRIVVPVAQAAKPAPVVFAAPPQVAPIAIARFHPPARELPPRAVPAPDDRRRILALFGMISYVPEYPPAAQTFGAPALPGPPQPPARAERSHWSASAWLLARDGGGAAASGGPLLGGGQAGARIGYSLARRIDLVGRISSPLEGRGREAALGIEWQPTKLPIRLVAEQRFALDRNSGGMAPAIGAIGGFGPSPVPAGFRLEAYAQAGAIERHGVSGFVDVQARATRPVAEIAGLRIDLGAGSWGSAQRGAARLDVGPTAGVALPVGRQTIRLSLDWRERIAGDARPESGPALTIGADF